MKTIYLVRHGEALNNVQPGHYVGDEGPLTALGEKQAAIIAERASHLPIEALVASTFTRAQQTAAAISKRIGISAESSELFVERRNPSSLVGRVWEDAETQRIEKEWVQTFFTENTRVLDGENFDDIRTRAQKALAFLENRGEDEILVVTHGVFLRALVSTVLFGEALTPQLFQKFEWGLRTKNTGLTVLKFDPEDIRKKWWVLVWNDHAHLG